MTGLYGISELLLKQLWTATWQGALAVLIGLLIARACRRLPAALHCWLWRIVCLKMLLAFAWVGTIELPLLPAATSVRVRSSMESTSGDPAEQKAARSSELDQIETPSAFGDVELGGAERSLEHAPHPSSTPRGILALVLASAWCVGVLRQLTILRADWRTMRGILKRTTPQTDATLAETLDQVARDLRIRPPDCRLSAELSGPIVIGVLRPTVLMPADRLADVNATQLRLLLIHELAHVSRRDLVWNWLAAATRCLFFFNPLVRLVERRLAVAQEMACDEAVLQQAPQALGEYARVLLHCCVPQWRFRFGLASGAFSPLNTLKWRIENMKLARTASRRTIVLAASCLAVAGAVGVVPWKLTPLKAEEQPAERVQVRPKGDVRNPVVSVAETFAIDSSEGRIARDSLEDPLEAQFDRDAFRDQIRRQRRLGPRGGRGGGTRSNIGGRTRVVGPNGTEAGGFAAGTTELPNYVVALRVEPLGEPSMITVAQGTVAIDEAGNTHEPLTQVGRARVAVPVFEEANPDCAGAYFHFSERPSAFKEIKGDVLVAPLHLHEAVFEMDGLREGARRNTEFGPIRVDTFDNSDGWQFEITTPGPGLQRRQVIKYLDMVYVELIDSEGQSHRPRSQTSGGGGGGGGGVGGLGRAPGIDELTRIVAFAALPEDVAAESLRVLIRETGEVRRVPFHLHDVILE